MNNQMLNKKAIITLCIVSIISGILFCVLKQDLLNIIFTIIGALMIVAGVIGVVKSNVIGGAIAITVGILMVLGAWLFTYVLLIINGVLLCLSGISGIALSVKTEEAKKCILSILMLVLGVMFFINTDETIKWVFYVIGALFIITGIMGLILTLIPSKKGVKTVDVKPIEEEEK